MRAGQRNRRIEIQQRGSETDSFGQPVAAWVTVGTIMAGIANETGLGAIRTSGQANVPVGIARYSFLVSFQQARTLAITAGMRIVHEGESFDIKGLTRDYNDRTRAYIICEQGGNDG